MTTSETIQASILLETLRKLVNDGYNRFYADAESMEIEELENLQRGCDLIGEVALSCSIERELERRK